MKLLLPATILFSLMACTSGAPLPTTTTSTPAVTPTTTPEFPEPCGAPGGFTEGSPIAAVGNADSDAITIALIAWDDLGDGCERFTFTFQSAEGAPAAAAPTVRAEFLADIPVLRLWIGSSNAVVSDQKVETALVDRLFAVRSLTGNMFVDLHLAGPVRARLAAADGPARVDLELLPGIISLGTRPVTSDDLVVVRPYDGATSRAPVLVAGYARGFDEGVLVLATSGTEILWKRTVPAAPVEFGWAEFRAVVDIPPGSLLLFVGEDLPGPGGLAGLVIPMTVE